MLESVVLRCRICMIEITLSSDPVVGMAEVHTFGAAHNSHDEGLGVELIVPLTERNDESA